jgi:hypothetical protein
VLFLESTWTEYSSLISYVDLRLCIMSLGFLYYRQPNAIWYVCYTLWKNSDGITMQTMSLYFCITSISQVDTKCSIAKKLQFWRELDGNQQITKSLNKRLTDRIMGKMHAKLSPSWKCYKSKIQNHRLMSRCDSKMNVTRSVPVFYGVAAQV